MLKLTMAAADMLFLSVALAASQPEPTRKPLVRAVDLSIGESREVELCDGTKATVNLTDLRETRDAMRLAVRSAQVTVEVNGERVALNSGNYHLPLTVAGVQIDCPVTRGYRENADEDVWALEKDARLRLWPAGSPLMKPGTFVYPAAQRWFASLTQMANEPVYVDGGERPSLKKIYYHYGLDIGGPEGLVDVIAATNGQVVSSGTDRLPGYEDTPAKPRYDVVYVLDDQGWYYRYSHLFVIDPAIRPGASVKIGQKIGVLGKEGGSGGWSHLHFDIFRRQPSGKWGVEEGYAYLWEAYVRRHAPKLVAVARPHHFVSVGDSIVLDGSRSWSAHGKIARYEWLFTDKTTATGPRVERKYGQPGEYSEVLKVIDASGTIDYDFAVVDVVDKSKPDEIPPTIHAAYAPTFGIQPGDPVIFKVRTFGTTDGQETWDFGDGTPAEFVSSDGNVTPLAKDGYAVTTHRYNERGHYLVRVERTDGNGFHAVAHLQVRVGEEK